MEGSDAQTASYYLPFPFTPDALDAVLENIEAEAKELWHTANCHGEDCHDPANCPGCSTTCGCFERREGTKVPTHAMAAVRSDRDVVVIAGKQDWDDGEGYLLRFMKPGPKGWLFQLVGDLDYLESVVEDARAVLADQRKQREQEEDEEIDSTPDDHPGFDPVFLTF